MSKKMVGDWQARSFHVAKDRAKWLALYAVVGNFKLAKEMSDDIIMWANNGVRAPDDKLREWAQEIDEGLAIPNPAIEKIMGQKVEAYKQNLHWKFLKANADAAIKLAEEVLEKGECKSPVTLSYLGNNVNFGMDKGEHARKQGTQQFNVNGGTVKIISSHGAPQPTKTQTKHARKELQAPIEGEVRVIG